MPLTIPQPYGIGITPWRHRPWRCVMSASQLGSGRAAQDRAFIEDTVFAARKSAFAAYLLWVFLGGFGMHNFYLGRPKAGGLQLVGTLFVFCTYVADDPWPLIGLVAG